MNQKITSLRRGTGLLLAAVALPLNPALAQDVTAPPAQPPVIDATPSPAPTPAPAPTPVIAPPAPIVAAPTPPVATPEPAPDPVATEQRTTRTTRTTTTSRAAPVRTPARSAPAAATRAPAPAAEPAPAPAPATAPLAATPGAPADAGNPAPAPAPAAETPTQPAEPVEDRGGSILPWLLAALLIAGAAFFLLRRRRRDEDVYYEEETIEPLVAAPAMSAPLASDTIAPAAVAPEVAAPAAAAAAAPARTGRPAIALEMRPVRAGVNADDAVVEFELTVDNRGTAPARDVRISTWMFAAGHASEAERALIETRDQAELPAVTIGEGDAKRIETAVALPTARIAEDAVLPVVVAEAHYRLPDGTEAQTTAAFEVGVQIGDELAHFDVENPSGLHDDVVARPHREAIDA